MSISNALKQFLGLMSDDEATEMKVPSLPESEMLILGLLIGRGPSHGLELVKNSDGGIKRGTVYVTLSRMSDNGLVESELIDTPRGPRRRYRPTGTGERVYRAQLRAATLMTAAFGGA